MEVWNISKIIIETIHEKFNITYKNIYNALKCTEQTGLNYRTGRTKPSKACIEQICQGVNELLDNEQKNIYIARLCQIFSDAGEVVREGLEKKSDVESLFQYLYNSFENDQKKDDMYALLNVKANSKLLQYVLMKKLNECTNSFSNFRVENIESILPKVGKTEKYMDMDNCLVLELKTSMVNQPYNVLINYNCTWFCDDKEIIYNISNMSDNLKEAGIRMSLIFTDKKISDKDVAFSIKSNMYIEQIQKQEIYKEQDISNYVFCKEENKYERVANIYSNVIVEHIKKYFQVAYKNIIFTSVTELDRKYPGVLWQAKYATRHHINFQRERLLEVINENNNDQQKNKVGIAIGFWGFPSILAKQEIFSNIYLFDNSLEAINKYEEFECGNPKVHCEVFTTMLFDYITQKYELYNQVDFILMGTGAGSFCRNIQSYLQMCNQWLKPNGKLYISFINKEFPYMYVDRRTQEENFEYIPKEGKKIIQAVPANLSEQYEMFGSVYECNELKNIVQNHFCILSLFSYPLACILQSKHKNQLQNILKEYDKAYSGTGFCEKNFSNSKGYYLDILLQKYVGKKIINEKLEESQKIKDIDLHNLEENICMCKTLLIKEIVNEPNELVENVLIIVMPSERKLPETENKEIILGNKKFQLLSIREINEIGLEYKNISPFNVSNLQCNVKRFYDHTLEGMKGKEMVVCNGSFDRGYKIKCNDLIKKLQQYQYEHISI